METLNSLSGLESFGGPPGTGRLSRTHHDAANGVDKGTQGRAFNDELRRHDEAQHIAERQAGDREQTRRLAERRADREQHQAERPGERAAERRPRRAERDDSDPVAGPSDGPRKPERDLPARPAGDSFRAPDAEAAGSRPDLGGGVEAGLPGGPAGPPVGGRPGQAAAAAGSVGSGAGRPAGPAAGARAEGPTQPPGHQARADVAERVGRAATPPDVERAARVFEQLKAALRPGLREAVIQLDPGDLGKVTIRVALDGTSGVAARLEAESPETLELIQRHLPELRAALADAGFEGAELELSLSRSDDRRADDGARDGGGHEPSSRRRAQASDGDEGERRPAARGDSAVDTYA